MLFLSILHFNASEIHDFAHLLKPLLGPEFATWRCRLLLGRIQTVAAGITEEHLHYFNPGLPLIHRVHYIQIIQCNGVDSLLVLVESVDRVWIQLEHFLNYLRDVIVAVVEVEPAFLYYISELFLRVLPKHNL